MVLKIPKKNFMTFVLTVTYIFHMKECTSKKKLMIKRLIIKLLQLTRIRFKREKLRFYKLTNCVVNERAQKWLMLERFRNAAINRFIYQLLQRTTVQFEDVRINVFIFHLTLLSFLKLKSREDN